jgi:hypothetical protein
MLEGSDKVNNNFKVLISHFKNLYGGPPPKATSLDRPSFICTEIVNCPNQERLCFIFTEIVKSQELDVSSIK